MHRRRWWDHPVARVKKPSQHFVFGIGIATIAAIGAMLVPVEATHKIQDIVGAKDLRTPFLDTTSQLDRALMQGFDIGASEEELQQALSPLAVRRLAKAGAVAGDEIPLILEILKDYQDRANLETSAATQSAIRQARNAALAKALPRLSRDKIDESLAKLESQIDHVIPRFANTPEDCVTCHAQTGSRSDEIDTVGIWPQLPADAFSQGFPVLSDTYEMRALSPNSSCGDCHVAHGEPGFLTTLDQRRENMGVWVHAYRIEDLLYVQVKVQNKHAAHYAPGGFLNHAYAVVVDAYQSAEPGGEHLKRWSGPELPEHLKTHPEEAGYLFTRLLRDAQGQPTNDLAAAVTIDDDTRLAPTRFIDLTFLYEIERDSYTPYSVVVRLVYLPDQNVIDGAQDIEIRIRSSED